MISVDYVQTMARYNAWQNAAVIRAAAPLDPAELTRERGAFFGTIQKTLNHILWGDLIWMSRLSDWPKPAGGIREGLAICEDFAVWQDERTRVDADLERWSRQVPADLLESDLTWVSASKGAELVTPYAVCVMHLFNHQTHHRGQVHAMLTAAGATTEDTDLPFLPGGF